MLFFFLFFSFKVTKLAKHFLSACDPRDECCFNLKLKSNPPLNKQGQKVHSNDRTLIRKDKINLKLRINSDGEI